MLSKLWSHAITHLYSAADNYQCLIYSRAITTCFDSREPSSG